MDPVAQVGGVSFILLTAGFTSFGKTYRAGLKCGVLFCVRSSGPVGLPTRRIGNKGLVLAQRPEVAFDAQIQHRGSAEVIGMLTAGAAVP
jgi:hypothetical protein